MASVLLSLCASLACAATNKADASPPASPRPIHVYRALIPLGAETFEYGTHKQRTLFYVMASTRNAEFEGQQVILDGEKHVLKTAAGVRVESYPQHLRFRVSVGERDRKLNVDSPLSVQTHCKTFDELISGLKFEMRVFHALKNRIVPPTKVAQIGIPVDVPAHERIYEVTFDVGDVPITDRMVMHVMTNEGERLAKFSLDLY